MNKTIFTSSEGSQFIRSKWLKIKTAYKVNRNNSLYDFSTDENGYNPNQSEYNPVNGVYLDYFTYKGCKYAIDQFIAIGSIACPGKPYEIREKDGSNTRINGVDFYGSLYDPLYCEFDSYGENVRIYKKVN